MNRRPDIAYGTYPAEGDDVSESDLQRAAEDAIAETFDGHGIRQPPIISDLARAALQAIQRLQRPEPLLMARNLAVNAQVVAELAARLQDSMENRP